jgi:hypothetical protein
LDEYIFDERRKVAYLSARDIYAPSSRQGFPVALIEPSALTVVAIAASGVTEIAQNGERSALWSRG